MMRYFKDSTGEVFGYSTAQKAQIEKALANGWEEITGAWPPPPSLDEIKARKKAELILAYNSALSNGVAYAGTVFQCDDRSVARLNAVLTAVNNGWTLPSGFEWIDVNNVRHQADVAFLQGLADAMATNNAVLFFKLRNAKDAVAAANTVDEVNAVTFG